MLSLSRECVQLSAALEPRNGAGVTLESLRVLGIHILEVLDEDTRCVLSLAKMAPVVGEMSSVGTDR